MADTTKYIAKPSGACCLKGAVHDGEPQGQTFDVENVETYFSEPKNGAQNSNVILFFPDIFGLSKNNRLVVDSIACAGYLVMGLDYFRGDDISKHMGADMSFLPGFDFDSWKTKHMTFAEEIVPKWIDAIKVKFGQASTKYACVGYCFGAPFAMDGVAGEAFLAGAFAHPAFLTVEHFEKAKKPLFLSCAGNDVAFEIAARRKAEDVLHSNKTPHHVQVFEGIEHGFALKGDLTVPYERYAKEESLKGMVSWFDFWLSQ